MALSRRGPAIQFRLYSLPSGGWLPVHRFLEHAVAFLLFVGHSFSWPAKCFEIGFERFHVVEYRIGRDQALKSCGGGNAGLLWLGVIPLRFGAILRF